MKKWLIILCIMLWSIPLCAQAKDSTADIKKAWMEELLPNTELYNLEQFLDEIFPEEEIHFYELLDMFLDEEKTLSAEKVANYIINLFSGTFQKNKTAIGFLFVLAIISAIFTNFTNIFQNKQISVIGFYVIYLIMISVCLHAFQLTIGDIENSIKNLLVFMKIFSPIYFVSMSISVGSISSIAFYNIVIWLIYIIELIIFRILLPLVRVYLTVQILNFLSEEEVLSKCSDFIRTFVDWTLKGLLAAITGINFVESMLSPALDTVKRNSLTKGIEMIPGIGDVVEGSGEMLLSIAVLIKNGIGAVGAVIIIAICLIPIVNMLVTAFLYKGLAAIIQPLSGKRFTETINGVGEGYFLLLKIELSMAALFLITIGIAVKAAG